VTQCVWFDLLASDATQARNSCRELLDWRISADDSGTGYESWILAGTRPWAGIKATAGAPGTWLPYIQVDDLQVARDRALGLGGTVESDVIPDPAGQSIIIADPTGAKVTLFVPAEAA
jgi:uncharacterized protein